MLMPALYFHLRNMLEGTYTLRILDGFVDLFWMMLPYMLVSTAIGVAATRFMHGRLSAWFTVRNATLAVPVAAVLGVISPLPTYAAVPLGISLMPAGVPFGAILAFAIASPLMNPSMFYLTAARLGMEMALVRTAAALFMGCAGGVLGLTVLKREVNRIQGVSGATTVTARPLSEDIRRASLYTLRVFSIAILISAAVKALVPAQMVVDLAGTHAATGTLVALGLGVPFYSCGGAAIPLVETLMDMGMGKGPVLAFFIAGPATKLETMYAIRTTMGNTVLVFYLGLTFLLACVAGLIYSLF
jgi:uncharacterized protein